MRVQNHIAHRRVRFVRDVVVDVISHRHHDNIRVAKSVGRNRRATRNDEILEVEVLSIQVILPSDLPRTVVERNSFDVEFCLDGDGEDSLESQSREGRDHTRVRVRVGMRRRFVVVDDCLRERAVVSWHPANEPDVGQTIDFVNKDGEDSFFVENR